MLLAFTLTIGARSIANAQPTPESDSQQDVALARYLEGEQHYAAGRYELAVEDFEVAFKLSGKPELHFNIANCHERAGNYAAAAASLETFLASANPPEPEVLRERIWRLKRRIETQKKELEQAVEERAEQLRAQERVAEQSAVQPRQNSPESALNIDVQKRDSKPSFVPAYLTIAVGGTGMVAGLIFAGISRSAGDDAASDCAQGFCVQRAEEALLKERRYARVADVTGLLGLATVGVGGYLWYRAHQRREATLLVASPMVSKTSAGFVVGTRF